MFIQKQLADFWRDITSLGSTLLYFIIVLPLFFTGKIQTATKLTAGYILIYIIAGAIKIIYFKNRPKKENYTNFVEKIDASAFPSIHSARATLMAAEISKLIDGPIATSFLFITAGLVCYSRIAIKKHYWTDIIGGIILGILTTITIGKLF